MTRYCEDCKQEIIDGNYIICINCFQDTYDVIDNQLINKDYINYGVFLADIKKGIGYNKTTWINSYGQLIDRTGIKKLYNITPEYNIESRNFFKKVSNRVSSKIKEKVICLSFGNKEELELYIKNILPIEACIEL